MTFRAGSSTLTETGFSEKKREISVKDAKPQAAHHRQFLNALLWQGASVRDLTEQEELALYERGWRMRGVLATPDQEELEHIREIARKYHSWLVAELRG